MSVERGISLEQDARWAGSDVIAARLVVDAHGSQWVLRQLDCRGRPGALGERSLIIENDSTVRRLWRYPAEWMQLDQDELRVLIQS